MITAIWILISIVFICLLLSVVAVCLGHCEIGLGEEYWEDERWEKLYYNVFAPIGTICLFASIVLGFIVIGIKS